jgi:hypothetical protein
MSELVYDDIIWYQIPNIISSLNFLNDEIADEIESYGQLPHGWDFGNGVPFSQQTILNAKAVYLACKLKGVGVEPHPNNDDTITLIAFIDDYFLEIDINDSPILTLRHAIGRGDNYRVIWKDKKVVSTEIEYELLEMKSHCKVNLLSESSTLNSIIQNNKSLEEIKFLPNIEEVYPYSAKIVQGV